ncbi:hypothetical protein PtB15_16B184 [Puccinia triticina]|nr:hypothetical protein PtB15_16B184 [Puccinia triticina]
MFHSAPFPAANKDHLNLMLKSSARIDACVANKTPKPAVMLWQLVAVANLRFSGDNLDRAVADLAVLRLAELKYNKKYGPLPYGSSPLSSDVSFSVDAALGEIATLSICPIRNIQNGQRCPLPSPHPPTTNHEKTAASMLGALGLGQKKARTKNLKLTKTLSNCSTTSASTTLTAVSSCPSTARKTVRGTRSLFSRLSATYQTITHLSSSFTDSLHSNATSCPSNPASLHPSCPSPLDTNQSDYNELSSHRRRILGSVTDQWPMYSSDPQDYLLGAHIGSGASSVVRLAHFKPRPGELCAVKVIDIDRLSVKQIEYLRRETLLMSLAKHPNVLRVRGEWIEESSLCIAMRLMQAGSIADLLRFRFQDGLPEPVIASVLIQAIAGLDYLHANGWIHRDLKAANLLLDHDGTVLLADFGVSIDRPCDPAPPASTPLLTRQTSFVGTALFMAPEVVTRQPYNDRADIVNIIYLSQRK